MVGIIAAGVAVGVAGVLGVASRKPDTFVVQRSASIEADADHIYSFLDDFRCWRLWSPWEDIDLDLERSYEGPVSGPGASYTWSGRKAGTGRMEITDVVRPGRLGIKLEFTKPFKATNRIELTLRDVGGVTTVDWVMTGANTFPTRLMSVFMSMDDLAGKDFEKGLARLKRAAEA